MFPICRVGAVVNLALKSENFVLTISGGITIDFPPLLLINIHTLLIKFFHVESAIVK